MTHAAHSRRRNGLRRGGGDWFRRAFFGCRRRFLWRCFDARLFLRFSRLGEGFDDDGGFRFSLRL